MYCLGGFPLLEKKTKSCGGPTRQFAQTETADSPLIALSGRKRPQRRPHGGPQLVVHEVSVRLCIPPRSPRCGRFARVRYGGALTKTKTPIAGGPILLCATVSYRF